MAIAAALLAALMAAPARAQSVVSPRLARELATPPSDLARAVDRAGERLAEAQVVPGGNQRPQYPTPSSAGGAILTVFVIAVVTVLVVLVARAA